MSEFLGRAALMVVTDKQTLKKVLEGPRRRLRSWSRVLVLTPAASRGLISWCLLTLTQAVCIPLIPAAWGLYGY